jgi:hypothetical protein
MFAKRLRRHPASGQVVWVSRMAPPDEARYVVPPSIPTITGNVVVDQSPAPTLIYITQAGAIITVGG